MGPATPPGRLAIRNITADVRDLHRDPEYRSALFQVALQFNLLEMTDPSVTPEQGVTRYQYDPTQGPACAIAAGAATNYRNFFVLFGDQTGQTASRQIDVLANVGAVLAILLDRPPQSLWAMSNGYALCTPDGLAAIAAYLDQAAEAKRDFLRAQLRIGLHDNVQVTDGDQPSDQRVSQAFCSALPVAYSGLSRPLWCAFAELVLEAAYEATLWAAALSAGQGGSDIVLLTRLGGGAFGNDALWIHGAIQRALMAFADFDLDVRFVNRD